MAINFEVLKWDILDALAPIIKSLLKEVLSAVLTSFYEKDELNAKLTMVSLYPVIDVKLQELVGKTETDLDDAVVEGTMEAFEKVAKDCGFSLPNLDED